MGCMSFAQELKALATASEGMDAGECWSKAVMFHRELGRAEHAHGDRTQRRFEHVAPEIRWTVERPSGNGPRRRGEGRNRGSRRGRNLAAA